MFYYAKSSHVKPHGSFHSNQFNENMEPFLSHSPNTVHTHYKPTENGEVIWMVTGGNTVSDEIESLYITKIDNSGGVASICVTPEMLLDLSFGSYVSAELVANETVLDGVHDTISVMYTN